MDMLRNSRNNEKRRIGILNVIFQLLDVLRGGLSTTSTLLHSRIGRSVPPRAMMVMMVIMMMK